MMRKPSIIIFGDSRDEGVIAFKCGLLQCGIGNFMGGGLDECGQCRFAESACPALFLVAGASVSRLELELIHAEARRLALPVFRLVGTI